MYYNVEVKCTNCGFHVYNMLILKGVLVVEEECPHCRTKSLIKKED